MNHSGSCFFVMTIYFRTSLRVGIDAGADDVQTSEEVFEIYTDPKEFAAVRDALEAKGYTLANAELTMIPENETMVPEDKVKQYTGLIDELEDNDDVSEVYEAATLPEDAE